MTNDSSYRLGNYRITVSDDILVRWERHVPLAMARSGKCFLFGDVLIIGSKFSDEDGFQIGEFLDSVRKLPPWTRTRFYCFEGELFDCATGHALAEEALEPFSSFAGMNRSTPFCADGVSSGTYRLGHNQITVAADHAIVWDAYGDLDRIVSGSCRIESGILIFGPQEYDKQGLGKQEFLDALSRLPQWDKTMAWCRGAVLRPCRETPQEEGSGIFGRIRKIVNIHPSGKDAQEPLGKIREEAHEPKPPSTKEHQYGETAGTLLSSSSDLLKRGWKRVDALKTPIAWIVLIIAVIVLIGFTAALYLAEKSSKQHHGGKERHHKHDDH